MFSIDSAGRNKYLIHHIKNKPGIFAMTWRGKRMNKRVAMVFVVMAALLIGCQARRQAPRMDAGCEECPLKSKRVVETRPKLFGLDLIIDRGLRNNLSRRVEIAGSKAADRVSLERTIKSVSDSFSSADKLETSVNFRLSSLWHMLDSVLTHVRAATSLEEKDAFLVKRCGQLLAFDIAWAFWEAAAVNDALDYAKTMRNADADSVNQTITRLENDFAIFMKSLNALSGLNLRGNAVFKRYRISEFAGNSPGIDEFNIHSLEERAMANRPELFENGVQILIQKEEARSAIQAMAPNIDFFATEAYRKDRRQLADAWKTAGLEIVRNLLNLSSRIDALPPGNKKENMIQKQHLIVTSGVIAQVHIAMLDYAINKDRYIRLGQTFHSAGDTSTPSDPKVNRGLEIMAAKLRLDEAAADCLVTYYRLCASIGVDHVKCGNALKTGF